VKRARERHGILQMVDRENRDDTRFTEQGREKGARHGHSSKKTVGKKRLAKKRLAGKRLGGRGS
jgi:hypothetical protein